MDALFFIFAATLFLAYANGANDNFKGVATLYGSGLTSFRTALTWATISTLAGSLSAAVFAEKLLKLFSGKGLVPDWLVGSPPFLMAVILGAGITVFITALRGIPISTTHALVGGIVGAGLMAAGADLNYTKLGQSFFLPLAVGPLIPIIVIGVLYPLVRWLVLLPINRDWMGFVPRPAALARIQNTSRQLRENISPDDLPPEGDKAIAQTAVLDMSRSANALHFLSAGAVGFARGLNDTPKIVAIALAGGALQLEVSVFAVAIFMGLGGLLHARRVAETMSHKITPLTPGQGTLANVVTSLLVIFASRLGLPVSTTHVSVGSIMGVGIAERRANWPILTGILSAWILTLPSAMALSAMIYWTASTYGLAP